MEGNISTFIIIHSPALYAISESVLLRLLLLPIAAQQQQGALAVPCVKKLLGLGIK